MMVVFMRSELAIFSSAMTISTPVDMDMCVLGFDLKVGRVVFAFSINELKNVLTKRVVDEDGE